MPGFPLTDKETDNRFGVQFKVCHDLFKNLRVHFCILHELLFVQTWCKVIHDLLKKLVAIAS